MKLSDPRNFEIQCLLPVLMTILFLTFSCQKTPPITPDRPSLEVLMEGDYEKTQDDCQPDESPYVLTITRDRPTKDDVVNRVDDGILLIKNLMNSPRSRIKAEKVGNAYRIPSQNTVLHGRSAEISGMLQKSGKKLTMNYRIVQDQEAARHCQSEFLDIR